MAATSEAPLATGCATSVVTAGASATAGAGASSSAAAATGAAVVCAAGAFAFEADFAFDFDLAGAFDFAGAAAELAVAALLAIFCFFTGGGGSADAVRSVSLEKILQPPGSNEPATAFVIWRASPAAAGGTG